MNGVLEFVNASLPGGQATFCQDSNTREVLLNFASSPANCEPAVIVVYGAEQCQNKQIVSAVVPSIRGSSSTQLVIGPSSSQLVTPISILPTTSLSQPAIPSGGSQTGTAPFSTPGSSSGSPTSSATPSFDAPCAPQASTLFVPSQDIDLDRTSADRLNAANTVFLNYVEVPGDRVMQIELSLNSAGVLLENSNRITSVVCLNSTTSEPSELTLNFLTPDDASRFALILSQSPGLVLITQSNTGCSLDTARGFWEFDSTKNSPATSTSLTVLARERKMVEVANRITLLYGKREGISGKSFTSTAAGVSSVSFPLPVPDSSCVVSATPEPSGPLVSSVPAGQSSSVSSTGQFSTSPVEPSLSSSSPPGPSLSPSPTISAPLDLLTTSSVSDTSSGQSSSISPSESSLSASLTETSSLVSSTESSATSSTSATASPTGYRPPPERLEDLTPGARELYDYFLNSIQVENNNIAYHVPALKGSDIPAAPYNPDDLAGQQAAEDGFTEAGLSKPADLASKATEGLNQIAANVCPPNSNATIVRRMLLGLDQRDDPQDTPALRAHRLADWLNKRLEARAVDGWDIACDDTVGELVGLIPGGDLLGLVCAGKSIYDARDAIKCLFGGCQTVTYIVTKTMTYDFNYSWLITYPTISQAVTYGGGNKVLSCVNCGFSISSISFIGKIIVVITNGVVQIQQADVTPGISCVANAVVRLQSDGPWNGIWNYNYKPVDLGPIKMDGAFRINPAVLYSIGIEYSTDSSVDITGGARFTWANAAATVNILQSRVTTQRNWKPTVEFTFPSFRQGSAVKLKPFIRWVIKMEIDIYDMIKLKPFVTDQTVAGIESTYSFTTTSNCPANQLAVNNYVYSANTIGFGTGRSAVLFDGTAGSAKQCLLVPGITPSPDELASLRLVGQAFCTEYINYRPPSTFTYTTQTSTVPTTTTTFVTTTVFTTATVTEYKSVSLDSYFTRTFAAQTTTVTDTSKAVNFLYLNYKRDSENTPTTTADGIDKRAVPSPALVRTWDATKISFACKQIATGTTTLTVTATTTATAGTVTVTGTVTRNQQAPFVTVTYTSTFRRYLGIATATAATVATETACPPSTVNKCFKLKIHGHPWTEGRYIRWAPTWQNSGWLEPDSQYGTNEIFYLTTQGHLVSTVYPGPQAYILGTPGTNANANDWGEVLFLWSNQGVWPQRQYAKCAKDSDPCSNGFSCSIIDDIGVQRFQMSIRVPTFLLNGGGSYDESSRFTPSWHRRPDTAVFQYLPVTLTYEDVACPCY
ncbi:hypothetical protein CGMCC3_g6859 [Colletotrichum fructicola]|uniref:Uncharacterized protein n=1 Tax=Colletotrichum fructicola (strain Nara gc5) TaxID=1213859 RepID=L2FU76_COLFN|nr:uncharacterized protein CGMCC3_g6859 [Colletotrichum fructicola]KAE9577165.1 hypothetical protein CGMCC3_g6859 [Colletotrichum fructicola]KAF4484009.1 hypothetical protein CGGC5_v007510 [Colletotrichum fructicola Nara gc5]KAF4905438.1 hypothetical protein CGCFRS4_v000670 [Colletotrichum fructicola]